MSHLRRVVNHGALVLAVGTFAASPGGSAHAGREPYVLGSARPDSGTCEIDISRTGWVRIDSVLITSTDHDLVIAAPGNHHLEWGRKRRTGEYRYDDSLLLVSGHRYEARVEEAHVFGGGHYGFMWIEDLATGFVVAGLKLPKLRTPEQDRMAGFRSPGQAQFFAAAWSGDTATMKGALERGTMRSNEVDWKGSTALMHAAREAQPATMRLLIEYGADVNARNRDGVTALHFAAQAAMGGRIWPETHDSGDKAIRDRGPQAVQLLLEHGAEVNPVAANGLTPFEVGGTRGAVHSMLKEAGGKSGKQVKRGK